MKSSKAKSNKRSPHRKSWLGRLTGRDSLTTKQQRGKRSLSGSFELLEAREVLTSGTAPFGYLPLALASDQSGAALLQDSSLQGAWGVALAPGGPLWVADNTHGTISRYQGSVAGSPFAATSAVAIPDGSPTGIVFNPTGDFVVGSGNTSQPAMFLIASQNGAIDGWNPLLGGPAVQVATVTGADFTGLAVASVTSNNTTRSILFAADFKNAKIDVFDGTFQPTTLSSANAFTDSNLPAGYAPYNIELIGTQLYVAYAKPDPANPGTPLAQPGNGVIDIYNLDGSLVGGKEFITPGNLRVPYGMAMAPSAFGDFQGDLLVADAGTGQILAYDSSGTFKGALNNGPGSTSPIIIPGIRGLAFGNGSTSGAGDSTTLFYSASNAGHGAVGEILNAFDQPLVVVPTSLSAAQGQAFSGTVATLADSNTNLTKDSFLAIIDWGNNKTTAGTISPNGSGGFNIQGVNTYATAGTRQVKITVSDQQATPHNVSVTAIATVTDPSFTPAGTTFTSTQNQAFSGSIGNFADPTGPGAAADYVANIDWGDGSTSAGSVTLTGANSYKVSGSHTYTQVGSFAVSALVSEKNSENNVVSLAGIGTIASTASVSDPNTLTASGTTLDATQGKSTTLTVATFTDTYSAATAGMFQATIDWGDGSTVSTGSVTLAGGVFTVTGSHAYVTNGPATVTVSISDTPGTATATATSTANVADGNTFTPQPMTFVAQPSQSFSGVVALFPDANPLVRAGDFTATIDWGDGSTSTIGSLTAANGTLTVSGSHTYATAGVSPQVSVSVFENAPGIATGTVTSTAVVPANDVTGIGGTISATAAGASPSQVLATFSPAGGNTATAFTASIDWGDGGSFTAGTVSTSGNGTYTVVGSHTYATPGVFAPDVIVYEATGTATAIPAAAITATANIASPVVLSAATITGTEHIATSYTVATFTDANQPGLTQNDFTATIDWGDGSSTSTGNISLSGGVFTVTGSHAFADEGTFNVKVTVIDTSPSAFSTSITSAATMADNDNFTSGTASLTATKGVAFSGPLAVFTNSDTTSPASDFTAVIVWGDGQDDASGTVTGSNGQFTVSGAHTYAQDGSFPLKVTIKDHSGLAGVAERPATANATVMPGAGYVATAATVAATSGQTFSGTIATFTDAGTTHPSTAFTAQINWGDGTSSTPGQVSGSNGNYTVSGSHAYATPGTFSATVQITESAITAVVSATSTANVSDGATLTANGATFPATMGTTFSGTVGTFTDTNTLAAASDFTATIAWGDGTTDTGASVTITGGTGSFTVSGAHSYAQAGSEAVKVTLSEKSPGTVSATATATASVTAATTTITGQVFNDANFNGVLDSGEQGLADITVFLNVDGSGKADGNPHAATDANGKFTLATTSTGTFAVMESVTPSQGMSLSAPTQALALTAGLNVSGVNLGNVLTSSVVPLTVSTTPPAAATDANTAYIKALYQTVLGRVPDSAGQAGWTAQLASGKSSRSDVALGFWVSPEHRALQTNQYFPAFLGRQDDAATQAAWVSYFAQNGGATGNQMAAVSFVTTSEYQSLHSGNTAFVDALYNDIDLRSADSAGESYWVGQLNSGAMTADQVAKAFVYGSEASTRVIDSFYSVFLHRAPDGASLQSWVNDLTSQTLYADQVAIDLLSSDEFFNDVTANQAPQFTSANSAHFTAGTASTFAVTTSGVPIGTITATGLPTGLTLVDNKDGTGTLTSSTSLAAGTYNFQLMVTNSIGTAAKQNFSLTLS